MFCLPEIHPRLARIRRFIVPGVLLLALVLTLGTWVGVSPQLRRIPAHIVVMGVVWLALAGLGRLRLPRWSLPVVTGILALGCLAVAFSIPSVLRTLGLAQPAIFLFATLTCALGISTLLLLPAVAVGRIAARGGSRRDGDVAMAIFASYVIGQFTTTERPKDYSSLRELGWFHNRPAAPKLRAARVAAAWRRCTQEFRRRPGDMFSSSASASNGSPRRSQSSALLARIASSKGSGT
jgi:hypothetical protein